MSWMGVVDSLQGEVGMARFCSPTDVPRLIEGLHVGPWAPDHAGLPHWPDGFQWCVQQILMVALGGERDERPNHRGMFACGDLFRRPGAPKLDRCITSFTATQPTHCLCHEASRRGTRWCFAFKIFLQNSFVKQVFPVCFYSFSFAGFAQTCKSAEMFETSLKFANIIIFWPSLEPWILSSWALKSNFSFIGGLGEIFNWIYS